MCSLQPVLRQTPIKVMNLGGKGGFFKTVQGGVQHEKPSRRIGVYLWGIKKTGASSVGG